MKKKLTLWMLIAALCMCMFACRHEAAIAPAPTVCFNEEVLPIFQSNCSKSNCHSAERSESGYTLDNYANIIKKGIIPGNAANSKIYNILLAENGDKIMPPPGQYPLSDEQKNLIKTWINEQAENTVNCGTCDSTQFTFTAHVQPIIKAHCLGCHGGNANDGYGIPLNTYDEIKERISGGLSSELYLSITHAADVNPMPQDGNKLSDCKIAVIKRWLQAGAPNN